VWCYQPNNTTLSLYLEKGEQVQSILTGIALFALKWLFLAFLAEKGLDLVLVVEYWHKEMNRSI
jgi:hypothetical protein